MDTDPKRHLVLNEIIETERIYVQNLQNLNDYIIQPLKDRTNEERIKILEKNRRKSYSTSWLSLLFCCFPCNSSDEDTSPLLSSRSRPEDEPNGEILSSKQIKDLFGQITLILNVNRAFLEDLEKVVRKNMSANMLSNELRFAEVILFRAHAFKLYSSFMSSFDAISTSIKTEKQTNPNFKDFIETQQKLIKKANKSKNMENTLSGFLITPVQRICRYNLLVRELCSTISKEVSPSNPQEAEILSKLLQARDLISEVAQYCNDKTREMSGSTRVLVLQQMLKKDDIVAPHRKVVLESDPKDKILYKKKKRKNIVGGNVKAKACLLHLFNDSLIVSKHPTIDVKDSGRDLIYLNINFWTDDVTIKKKDKSKAILLADKSYIRKLILFRSGTAVGTLKFEDETKATLWITNVQKQMDESSHSITPRNKQN
ncbi:RacGEF [Acrasis kona]|uniref:RacGEF n=1 Tax=Acrasis kona TaxID=1008807 RepID=A0AAW2ZKI2_9EUKA